MLVFVLTEHEQGCGGITRSHTSRLKGNNIDRKRVFSTNLAATK